MFEMLKRAFGRNRTAVSTPLVWESKMGYARGVRVGSWIFIAGTVAADDRGLTMGCTISEQTDFVIRKIRAALRELGGDLHHVVRTDTFLIDFAHFDGYAAVHRQYFGEVPPVNTTVQCARLVNPDHLVEISAIAVVESS
jgi:enamine deaminase RidA (YjgF/YER057c/UK114 family)